LRVSNDEKAIIGKYAAEHGIVNVMTLFAPDSPNLEVQCADVSEWVGGWVVSE